MTALLIKPPPPYDPNQSTGWFGYYCGTYLRPSRFTITNIDGSNPGVWLYRKRQTGRKRVIEESLTGQKLTKRQSEQEIIYRELIKDTRGEWAVYVLWEAERLRIPNFPIRVTRLGATADQDATRTYSRPEFDAWVQNGLDPIHAAYQERPFTEPYESMPPPDCPEFP